MGRTWRGLMKLLKIGILALSLTVTATVGLAADYEIFAEFATVETGVNHYAVERLDHKNKKLYHCTAVFDAETKQLTGQCIERPGFLENPTGKGPNVQGGISNIFGGLLVLGSWKIDQITGKTEFCISGTAQ
jgi:hypothetical protein